MKNFTACFCLSLLAAACGGEQGDRVKAEYEPLDVPDDPCEAIVDYTLLDSHLDDCPEGEACLWLVDGFEGATADNGYISIDNSTAGEKCDPDAGDFCSDGQKCIEWPERNADGEFEDVYRCRPWAMDAVVGIDAMPATLTEELPKARCEGTDHESTRALHIQARGLSECANCWGMSFGNSFSYHMGAGQQLVDAREWDGIALWVRQGSKSEREAPLPELHSQTLLAQVREKHTESNPCQFAEFPLDSPECEELLSDLELRDQDPSDATPAISECWESSTNDGDLCDRFGRGVGIGEEWRWVRFRFDSMSQGGWGWPASCLSRKDLIGMAFDFQDAISVDVWIDDIALFKDPSIEGNDPPSTTLCDLE